MCLVQTLSLPHPFLKADPSPEADWDLARRLRRPPRNGDVKSGEKITWKSAMRPQPKSENMFWDVIIDIVFFL